MKKYIKLARLDHWIKQFFMIPGILIALMLIKNVIFNYSLFKSIVLSILSTCFIASANYVLNEYFDAKFDKYHPFKKNRVLVTHHMNKKIIFLEYFFLLFIGIFCSIFVSKIFFVTSLLFILMGILYNIKPFRLKDIVYLDVLSESLNNGIRFLLGWFAITGSYLPPVSIVFGYWMLGAYLMALKRFSEYRMFKNPKEAVLYRKSFKEYNEKNLLVSSIFYALLSVFFCGTFLIKYRVELLLAIPLLIFIFCYYLYLSFQTNSAVQAPEKLYKEKKLLLLCFIFFVLVGILLFIDIPILNKLINPELIKL